MKLTNGQQIIKTRDDTSPVRIEREETPSALGESFRLSSKETCTWAKRDESIEPRVLRSRIEPWLTALVQSEHLSVLIGSGLTHAIHSIAVEKPLHGMASVKFGVFDDEITAEAERIAKAAGRQSGNFEDHVRVATELLRGMEILHTLTPNGDSSEDKVSILRKGLNKALESFAVSILKGERNLLESPNDRREEAFNYLVNFLMSFASRSGTRERLNVYTTNYDRWIEAGADVAGLRLIDRFVGTLSPIFRASRLDIDLHYNPPGIRGEPRYLEGVARFTKLHGSIDWIDHDGTIRRVGLPFGSDNISSFLGTVGTIDVNARQLMIYPNSAKDRETSHYPYVELFRDLATTICRPNSTLICYGHSLGDEHINRVIEDMLTIPSTHLVIIAYADPLGRIMGTYEKLGRPAQMTLLIGDHLGDLRTLVDRYLPKSAIDRTTFRMADLLRSRWSSGQDSDGPGKDGSRNREDTGL